MTALRTAAITQWDVGYKALVVQTIMRPKDRQPTGAEIAMFAEQVQRTGLDPFFRQIYAIYRYDKRVRGEVLQVQVAIDGFRLIAHRTKEYIGQEGPFWCGPDRVWHDVWIDDEPPTAAKIGVWRNGGLFWGVARFNAYAPRYEDGNLMGLWATMGDNQIAKCAEALALRKGFPAELSGLYTPEEMEQADNEAAVSTQHDAAATAVEEPADGPRASLIEAFDRAVAEGVSEGKIKTILVAHGAEDTSDLAVTLNAIPADSVEALTKDLFAEASRAVDERAASEQAPEDKA